MKSVEDEPNKNPLREVASVDELPSAEEPTEKTPLSNKKQKIKKFTNENIALFIGSWGMMVGWSAGDVILITMKKYFNDNGNFHTSPFLLAGMTTLATLLFIILLPTPIDNFSGMLMTLCSHAAGVMLGRSWNSAAKFEIAPDEIGLHIVYAIASTGVALLIPSVGETEGEELKQTSSKKLKTVHNLLIKITAMSVAWAWADTSKIAFTEYSGDKLGELAAAVIWACAITLAACLLCKLINYVSPLAVAVFGVSVGYSWQRFFHQILFKESWAPVVGVADDFKEVALLMAFAFTITVAMSISTFLVRERASKEDTTFFQNALRLLVLTAGIVVGWSWGDVWLGVFNLVLPDTFATDVTGKATYFIIVLLMASGFIYLRSKNVQDDALGADAGGDAGGD